MRDRYIELLIKLLDYLTDEEIKRVYQLAEYLGIHKKKGGANDEQCRIITKDLCTPQNEEHFRMPLFGGCGSDSRYFERHSERR